MSDDLDSFDTPVEIYDQTGRLLGHFVPTPTVPVTAEQATADGCPCTQEELQQAWNETGGRTLAEIWRDLGRS